jgi:Zn-finger nucleic acid-binding protein
MNITQKGNRAMNCPKCQGTLQAMTIEGVDVDFCDTCYGIWFDEGEVAFMMELPADIPDPEAERRVMPTNHLCPRCGNGHRMEEIKFSKVDGLLLDRCPTCKGIWLDPGELRKLEHIAVRIGDVKSKILIACKQLQQRGYEVMGVKA